jgi:flagellar hook protein FlgE
MRYHFIFILLLITAAAAAQKNMVSGYLRDSITHFAIAGGTIKNNSSNKSVRTNEKGFFVLPAASNDLIYASAPNYKFDTVRYASIFADTIQIFLTPGGSILPTVTVTSGYSKYQLDSAERRSAFMEQRGTMPKMISRPNTGSFGIGINLDRVFKHKDISKKKYTTQYEKIEEQAYVDYRFSPQLVAFYTGLKGDQLRQFLYLNTPTYKWLRQHPSNEEVLYFINDRLKAFKAAQLPL